jgi:hypothetical protein
MSATTKWNPTKSDLDWCSGFLRTIADGGIWATTNGIYRVEHSRKVLTQIARAPGYDPELHERNCIAFGQLGWEVKDETHEDESV